MFCRLCIREVKDCDDFRDLYTADGQQNDIYDMTANYFAQLLVDTSTTMNFRVICLNCWVRISEFHNFEESVLAAQEEYIGLLKFEEVIKLEMGTALEQVQLKDDEKIKDDPVQISLKEDVMNLLPQVNTNNSDIAASYYSSDDEKPLLSRIQSNARNRRNQRKVKTDTVANLRHNSGEVTATAKKVKIERKPRLMKTLEQDKFISEHWKRELPCELCSLACPNFSALVVHFREMHCTEKAYVVCCQRKFLHRFHLVEHVQVHINPQYFKCPECGKCSANRRSLANHIKSMHPAQPLERRYECEDCHKRFAKLSVLRGHMETHATGSKDYVCAQCGKGFVLETRLNTHIRNVHTSIYSSVCELCGKFFRGRYVLKAHLLEHEGYAKRKWACDFDGCDAELHSKFSLRRHMRLAHHDGSTIYKCSKCGKVALTEEALRSHKKYVHEKERKFKCNICEKAFKVAVVLKEHMTIHTGEDLYQCPHCPKTFKVSANMHHHRKRVHPKEWEENRQHRALASQADLSLCPNEVVL